MEETLNGLLEAEAQKLTQAAKYERSEERRGYRSGHYSRNLTTTSGDVTLHVTSFHMRLQTNLRITLDITFLNGMNLTEQQKRYLAESQGYK